MAVASAFSPFHLRGLTLRNRIIKAATFEGMCADGMPSAALVEHHRQIARGGAAMTTVAYCSVASDGRSYDTQLWMRPEAVAGLRELTAAVHYERGAASIQLGHCGDFADKAVIKGTPIGASRVYNRYRGSYPRVMTEVDISRVIGDFARAAGLAVEAGFDAIELQFGHGYLISQFLSPYTNRRDDRWGGSLDNRARLAVEIARVVRSVVGAKVPVLAKINLLDGFRGGLQTAEAIEVAVRLQSEGIDAFVMSGGFVSKSPLFMLRGEVPVVQMAAAQKTIMRKIGVFMFSRLFVQEYPFQELFFLDEARALRKKVNIPLVLLGGIKTRRNLQIAMAEGFELVGMARALIHEPDLVNKFASQSKDSSDCVPCNECVGAMERGGVECMRREAR